MENNFISYVIKTTLFLTIPGAMIVSLYLGGAEAMALLLGSVWGMANLYFIKISLEKWLVSGTRDHLVLFALFQLKFPLLYLAGYGLLKVFPPIYLVGGSSLIFLSIFFLGIYKAMTQTKGLV